MALKPPTGLLRFQDPLLSWLAQLVRGGARPGAKFQLLLELAETIRSARAKIKPTVQMPNAVDPVLINVMENINRSRFRFIWKKMILIGCSAGGEVAMRSLFRNIKFPHLPIVIAMHHKPGFKFTTQFELANQVSQRFQIAQKGKAIEGARVYFLPSLVLNEFSLPPTSFIQKPLTYRPRFRPEIDKVMDNASQRLNNSAIGVILSGMLNDGAEGAQVMKAAGNEVWIQEPASALFKEMPRAAQRTAPAAKTMNLVNIGQKINYMTTKYLSLEPYGN